MKFQALNFKCPNCGAPTKFSPVFGKLKCDFCESTFAIEQSVEEISENDYFTALEKLSQNSNELHEKDVKCTSCGSSFKISPYSISTLCPFCGTPAIVDFVHDITPKSLLPFSITQIEAKENFKKWIGSLWFAPSALGKYFRENEKLQGYYLPYWTYDSETSTSYSGQRGDIYYVTVNRTVTDNNGRVRNVRTEEPRIRWTPVSGRVSMGFDDVTIGASKTISRVIIESLGPWDTSKLKVFDERYLSGFESEEYTIGLDNGFEYAKAKMSRSIEQLIREDIGGDQQQITSVNTQYNNVTYKNVLFPIWTATFEYKEKLYKYAINAQTGKISGEHPISYLKVAFAILSAISLGAAVYYANMQGYI
ncbi:Primosomal protein N' (replication factor Y)-superfamily II helicase [hydrothermal vent metagenome]|uniref:Primosomal protein N' (Replication factor Y)-superfamily II helicase n=1 Tax=hydrothermal vent metagenome TaxID=652676 RepID=A0A1W1EF44_9ZZZZ